MIDPEVPEEEYIPGMLEDAESFAEELETTALAPAGATTGLALGNARRSEIESKHLELRRIMASLEKQRRELQVVAEAMRTELRKRMEQIWLIELFLGSKEEVLVLSRGEPAPVGTRIVVHQRVLCMDEEIAVTDMDENPERVGKFDCQNIEDFDTWLKEADHRDRIIPEQKGICALRVRRRTKVRESRDVGQALHNAQLAEADRNTYVLVRNGENLYRLWVDIVLWPRLIPRVDDLMFTKEDERWGRGDKEQERKHFAAGMLVINGLLQRSELLHPLPRMDLNVFSSTDVEEFFQVIHDDEGQNLLGDGRDFEHLTWERYVSWLLTKVGAGVRIIWTGSPRWGKDEWGLAERTGNRRVSKWPNGTHNNVLEVYTLQALDHKSYFGHSFTFMYLPRKEHWADERRKTRLRFGVYSDEILPIDFMSWRVMDHLIRDRGQREKYGGFFPVAILLRRYLMEQAQVEKPFIDLVLTQSGVSLDDDKERARAERLLRWWKHKVKEHRTVWTDDAKALRMVGLAFTRGRDYDDDPEMDIVRLDKRKEAQ